MKTFRCVCQERIFFRNSRCLTCQRELGFLPDQGVMTAIEPLGSDGGFQALATGQPVRKCLNYSAHEVCNWLVPAGDPAELCRSCRLNRVIPQLEKPETVENWCRIEEAKRHLLYTLFTLKLPVVSRAQEPDSGLAFEFKEPTPEEPVLTGHADGVITLNLVEADPVAREEMRVKMRERYRTLLGHFRHEIGHYYWAYLIERDPSRLAAFRDLFGDDREDYGEALQRHYAKAPGSGWSTDFITEYASSHPWEDWAETWAHYLHMTDTFETAAHYGVLSGASTAWRGAMSGDFDSLLKSWMELTIALNSLGRSMGLPDPYPFDIGKLPGTKLQFVHDTIQHAASKPAPAPPPKEAEDPKNPENPA